MRRILVLCENALEREIVGKILSSGLRNTQVILAETAEQALQILRDDTADLFLADIDRFDLIRCNMVAMARKLAPDTPILVTSAGSKEDVANYVWRLGIRDYLLKPHRPAWLLAAVSAMCRTQSGDGVGQREEYLERLIGLLRSFRYQECIDTAREYLDLLHKSTQDKNVIRQNALLFTTAVARAGEQFSAETQNRLFGCVERYQRSFSRQENKYATYEQIVKILDILFDAMDQDEAFGREANEMQRILNYIDRKIKQDITLEKAAEYANMNPFYFSKLFKKITGRNYISYVVDRKVAVAKHMLADTDISVSNIAYALSYRETNYFSKLFRKKVGLSPSEYRAAHSGHRKLQEGGAAGRRMPEKEAPT